jgi:acetaldehyde dehydrogenase (acetylating)
MEKLSPILAFYVVDGLAAAAKRSQEVLGYGGMGHTAGMHTRSREAAIRYGEQMPASRVVINSPTTHGAIGFSTDLSPSMTLGCGSWGGNVTSDNVSPIHLLDIKRVAFETKPVNAARPHAKQSSTSATTPVPLKRAQVKREEIAAIVDSFLSKKLAETPEPRPEPVQTPQPAPAAAEAASPVKTIIHELRPPSENGAKPVPLDFVSEDDVRRAIGEGKKVYITAKTIITPSARDLGEEKDVFAKI